MRLVLSGLFFRARRLSFVVVMGLLPSPALALMPWSGDGAGHALYNAIGRGAEGDFRDYLNPGMPGPNDVADASPEAPVVEVVVLPPPPVELDVAASDATTPYDWAASTHCGPTDWDCTWCGEPTSVATPPPPVLEAVKAVGRILPSPTVALPSWESVAESFGAMQRGDLSIDQHAERARRGAQAALRVTMRSVAGRMSGTLDVLGRQLLNASEALTRVAEAGDAPLASTAARPAGPQPAKDPYSHLGL